MTADATPSEAPGKPTLLYRAMLNVAIPLAVATWVSAKPEGLEHIPRAGPFILVSNHVDNNDSYLIGRYLSQHVHFLARADGLSSRILGRYWRAMGCIPADREGLARALTLLRAGDVVGVYADGVITPRLLQAKAGVAALAVRAGVPVVPVAVWGTEKVRIWPLPHGRRVPVHVRFGAPRTFDRRTVRGMGLQQITDLVMTDVAAMLPPAYRGYYAPAVEARQRRNGTAAPAMDGHRPHEVEWSGETAGAGEATGVAAGEAEDAH